MLHFQAAQYTNIIIMKVLCSHNDRVQGCLDLLKICILQLPVVLQPSTRDSNRAEVRAPFSKRGKSHASLSNKALTKRGCPESVIYLGPS